MAEINPHKRTVDYYSEGDYIDVNSKLPAIVERAERKALDVLDPNIKERKSVRTFIKKFIKGKGRKIYGGTAINELLKAKNPNDAIYNEYTAKDIEFYSYTPVMDLVELCNGLQKAGFTHVQGKNAQHEGTYSIFINFLLYCDITYIPKIVYYGIKTEVINGVNYCDPHFIWIDHLRIYNAPLTAYHLWEKNFKRTYLLLKNYPVEAFSNKIHIEKASSERTALFTKIKKIFLTQDNIGDFTLLGGFDAYNYYIKKALNANIGDEIGRIITNLKNSSAYEASVPFVELFSVSYQDTVLALYAYLKTIVSDIKLISFEENFPLFQFTGYSITINYDNNPLVKVYESDGYCIPVIKVGITGGSIKVVSYQYVIMTFLMHKFWCHLYKDKDMYKAYGSAVSNLIYTRNAYLDKNKLSIINDTIFSEFPKGDCTGSTVSISRDNYLKLSDLKSKGKNISWKFVPDDFLKKSIDEQEKWLDKNVGTIIPNTSERKAVFGFPNTSGNLIRKPKNMRFKLTEYSDLIVNITKKTAEELSSSVELEQESDVLNQAGGECIAKEINQLDRLD